MRFINTSLFKPIFVISVFSLLQGCSTFRSCEPILRSENYQSSPHFKSIAMYFDRETLRPPRKIGGVENECWFDIEGNSQEEANSIVLSGCEDSLRQIDKFEEWSCILTAEGDQLTEFEQNRIDEWKRLSGRTGKEDSRMVTGTSGDRSYTPPDN
jgi:hypothetical protein